MNLLAGGPLGIGNALAAVGALGTAAYGLVDVSKALWNGGPSSAGFADIDKATTPFAAALAEGGGADWRAALKSHWINGVPLDDQKAKTKALIRLGLTPATAVALAAEPSLAGRVDGPAFALAAANIAAGLPLTPVDLNVLGRFDAIVSVALDSGFERADQRYRALARMLACIVAVILAVSAAVLIDAQGGKALSVSDIVVAILVGLVSTPLAPVAKDLTKALSTAASALKAAKG